MRWVNRGRTWDLGLGSVFVILAVLIRQPGVALALIPLAYWLLARVAGGQHRSLPWAQRMWLLVPFMAIGLLLWWIHAVHGATRVSLEKAEMLRLIFAIDRWVWVYVRELLHALLHLGLVLWPLTWLVFGRLSTRALAGACAAVAVLSGLVLWQEGALPQPLGINFTWDELGLARDLIAGQIAHRQLPRWGERMVLGVALSGAVGLVAVLWERLRRWPRGSGDPSKVLVLHLLLQTVLFEALWLYYDRYYLPLLPAWTALLVARLRSTKMVINVATAGVLLWGTIAVTGTIDQFRYLGTVIEARDWLLRQGVAAAQIDAGYALSGWWLYAHAPDGPPSRGREPLVSWVTGWPVLPYKIANVAEPSYAVVRSFRRPMLWAASDTLYVLEHTAVTDHWGFPSLRGREREGP